MNLDASRIVLGTYGQMFINGVWQTNVHKLVADVAMTKKELNLSGDIWTRHKRGPLKGTGTISEFKVTSDMIAGGFAAFEIVSNLQDPEAYGFESVRLKNVIPDKIQLANWEAGNEITDDIGFTFEGYELLNPIVAS